MRLFIKYATQWNTVARSLKLAGIVGTLLAAINHYDMLLSGVFSTRRGIQIIVTYLVPFSVSTISAGLQGREMEMRRTAGPIAIPPYQDAKGPSGN